MAEAPNTFRSQHATSRARLAIAALTAGQHNWAIRRRERAVVKQALLVYANGRLVDIGCGRKPYAAFLRGRVASHIGVDRADSPHGTRYVDVIGDALDTGLPNASADTVLMTQVLEHVPDPARALKEASRLLVPGGHLILSTNFAWHLHEAPRDFFRFSEYGLRHLFDAAGFDVLDLRPVAGTWLTVFEEIAYGLRRATSRRWVLGPIALAGGHLAQVVGLVLDRVAFDPVLTSGYLVVGRRRAGAASGDQGTSSLGPFTGSAPG